MFKFRDFFLLNMAFKIKPLTDNPIQTAQLLGHSNIVQHLKKFIESDEMITPLSIAIHGDWGSGKTSIMKTLDANLDQQKISIIFFEAWKYEYSNPSLGLITEIAETFSPGDKANNIIRGAVYVLSNALIGVDTEKARKIIQGTKQHTHQLSERLQEIITEKLGNKKLVIIFDDLDRCNVENTLQLLALMKLFLDIKNCICIAAVDFNRLRQAWLQKYKIDKESKNDSSEYLEKIFQIRIGIPKPLPEQIREYIETLTEQMPEELLGLFSKIAPKNPRSIKRILNLISYRASILNSDVNYESASMWTLLEDIVGNDHCIEICDVLKKQGNSLDQLIIKNGDNWKTIRDLFNKIGLSEILQLRSIKLPTFFNSSKALMLKNTTNQAHFGSDFDVLYNATNEALK